jgi:hypothetical protein
MSQYKAQATPLVKTAGQNDMKYGYRLIVVMEGKPFICNRVEFLQSALSCQSTNMDLRHLISTIRVRVFQFQPI